MKRILLLLCLAAVAAGVTAPVEIGRVNIGNGRDTIGANRLGLAINATETTLNGLTVINALPFTFSRALIAYEAKSITKANSGQRRTYPYSFGRFLAANGDLIEGSRKNVLYPSSALNTTPWLKDNSGSASAPVCTEGQADPYKGVLATRVQMALNGGTGSGDKARVYWPYTFTLSHVYPASMWVKSNTASTYNVAIYLCNYVANTSVTPTWTRLVLPPFTGAGAANYLYIVLRGSLTTSDSCDIVVSRVNIEDSCSFSSSDIDTIGSVTRPADILTCNLTGLAGGGLSATAGTLHLLVEPLSIDQDGATNFVLATDTAGNFSVARSAAGVLTITKKDGAGTRTITDATCVFAANAKKLITVTWDATSLRCYVNGSATGTPVTGLAGAWSSVTSMVIGSAANGDGTLSFFGHETITYDTTAESAATIANVATTLGF